jgi:hypothetical protein
MSDSELFEAFLLMAIATLTTPIGLTCGPDQDCSILSTLMNGWDSLFGYEHPLLRFFTMKEARELRLVCREFKDNVEVTSWNDPTTSIGRWGTTPVGRHLQLWRECFPMAIAASISLHVDHILRDEDFAFLRGIHTLEISDAVITDAAFPHLRGIRQLKLRNCSGFTDDAFPYLQGIEYLDISGCNHITDAAFPYLRGINYLDISFCTGITDAAFGHLQGIQSLVMRHYSSTRLTNAALAPLRGIKKLIMGFGHGLITHAGYEQLEEIEHLEIPRHEHPLIHLFMPHVLVEDTVLRAIKGSTPLWIHALDHHGCSILHWAAKRGVERIVRYLLEYGVNPTTRNEETATALHWAVQRGHAGIVNLLLDRGVDASVKNIDGDTPLHWAIKYQQVAIAHLLVDRGAKLNVQNRHKKTPLACAVNENKLHPTDELAAFIAKIQELNRRRYRY